MSDHQPFHAIIHPFTSPTPNACAYERGTKSSRNALVFIGGLTEGPQSNHYVQELEKSLKASPHVEFTIFESRMRSSYGGFGYSSLANDVEDISALVAYLKSIGKEKIVLMGTSTGKSSLTF